MTRSQVKIRIKVIFSIVGEILWRSFGLYVKYLKYGVVLGGVGAGISGDISLMFWSLLAAFVPAVIDAYSEIGEEIARTNNVTKTGINRAFNKAVDALERQEKEASKKPNA